MTEDAAPVWIKWEKSLIWAFPVSMNSTSTWLCCAIISARRLCVADAGRTGEKGKAVLSDAIRETVGYAMTHFQTEEKLMSVAGFESLAEHKNSHHAFIEEIREILAALNHASLQSAVDFSIFLHDWILAHIAYEDRLYAASVLKYINVKTMINQCFLAFLKTKCSIIYNEG